MFVVFGGGEDVISVVCVQLFGTTDASRVSRRASARVRRERTAESLLYD